MTYDDILKEYPKLKRVKNVYPKWFFNVKLISVDETIFDNTYIHKDFPEYCTYNWPDSKLWLEKYYKEGYFIKFIEIVELVNNPLYKALHETT